MPHDDFPDFDDARGHHDGPCFDGGCGHDFKVNWKKGHFVAECSCLWQGPERDRLREASDDGDQHLALIGA